MIHANNCLVFDAMEYSHVIDDDNLMDISCLASHESLYTPQPDCWLFIRSKIHKKKQWKIHIKTSYPIKCMPTSCDDRKPFACNWPICQHILWHNHAQIIQFWVVCLSDTNDKHFFQSNFYSLYNGCLLRTVHNGETKAAEKIQLKWHSKWTRRTQIHFCNT